jgi:hypothetical protein
VNRAVRSGGGSATPISRAWFAPAWSIEPEMPDRSTPAARVILFAPGFTISIIPRCSRDASPARAPLRRGSPPCPAPLDGHLSLARKPRENPTKTRKPPRPDCWNQGANEPRAKVRGAPVARSDLGTSFGSDSGPIGLGTLSDQSEVPRSEMHLSPYRTSVLGTKAPVNSVRRSEAHPFHDRTPELRTRVPANPVRRSEAHQLPGWTSVRRSGRPAFRSDTEP